MFLRNVILDILTELMLLEEMKLQKLLCISGLGSEASGLRM